MDHFIANAMAIASWHLAICRSLFCVVVKMISKIKPQFNISKPPIPRQMYFDIPWITVHACIARGTINPIICTAITSTKCCSRSLGLHKPWLFINYHRDLLHRVDSVWPSAWGKYPSAWWRHQMETFSALLVICAENSPVPGEFPAQRPVTRSFDIFFDLRPNKRLSKQSWGWWSETP